MKQKQLRRTAPVVQRLRHGQSDSRHGRFGGRFAEVEALALPITAAALVATALLTGAAFVSAATLLPVTVPTLLVGWVAAIGIAFAAPLAVVRGVVALLERRQ